MLRTTVYIPAELNAWVKKMKASLKGTYACSKVRGIMNSPVTASERARFTRSKLESERRECILQYRSTTNPFVKMISSERMLAPTAKWLPSGCAYVSFWTVKLPVKFSAIVSMLQTERGVGYTLNQWIIDQYLYQLFLCVRTGWWHQSYRCNTSNALSHEY